MLTTQIIKILVATFFFCFSPADNFEVERKSKYIFLSPISIKISVDWTKERSTLFIEESA